MLQCVASVATCCSVLQRVVMNFIVAQWAATGLNLLHDTRFQRFRRFRTFPNLTFLFGKHTLASEKYLESRFSDFEAFIVEIVGADVVDSE